MSELRRLRLLVEFAQRETIAAVAAAVSFSPSAVSQQLAQLEREFGVKLFEPDGRRLRLTPEGQELARRAPSVIAAWETAHSAVALAGRHPSGPVRVAAFQTAFLAVIPPLNRACREMYPDVSLTYAQLEPEAALPAVISGSQDVALVERYSEPPVTPGSGLVETQAVTEKMYFATSVQESSGDPADFAQSPWVLETRASRARAWAADTCRRRGFEPQVRFETPDVIVQCAAIAAGDAVGFLPGLTPPNYTAGLRLHEMNGEFRTLSLVYRRAFSSHPALDAVMKQALKLLRDQTGN